MASDDTSTASVAGRYASALFDLARDSNSVPAVEADLAKFQSLLDMSDDLKALVRSPVVSSEDQLRAVRALLTKVQIGGIAGNFIQLLARNRRLFVASDAIRSFSALAAKARGEVVAEVTSATPLTDAQQAQLRDVLKASAGKDVKIAAKVDPSLIGGLVVKLGSRMIDSSIKTKLANLTVALKATA